MEERKYNLLIADDEYWIREKYRKLIDYGKYNINFLEMAENGEEVLTRLETQICDILITDIDMPFVNGVELIRTVKEKYPHIVIFVVSGYDDFDYVKNSLTAGAIDYLLKPINKIDFISALSKALEIIAREEENRLQTLKASSLIRDREMSVLVERDQASFSLSMVDNDKSDNSGCSMMLIKIHRLQKLMGKYSYDLNLLSYMIKSGIREISGIDDLLIFNYIFRANEFLVVSDLDTVRLRELGEKIIRYSNADGIGPITIAVSEHNYSMENLHDAYVQAVAVLMMRNYNENNSIIFFNQEKEQTKQEMKTPISAEHEGQMRLLLNAGNVAAIKQFVRNDIGIENIVSKEWNYLYVKQAVKRLCIIIVETLGMGASPAQVEDMLAMAENVERSIEQLNVQNLLDEIDQFIDEVVPKNNEEGMSSIKDVVRLAARYIDENYFEDITLKSLSEKYHVESTYFSRMFKQEIGQNLMQYVTTKRISKAKDYIIEGQRNMTEIAFLVGYDDYTYFNRVFKKYEGINPRDYKHTKMSN